MRRFLIDTDTGSDDAVALILAARHPDVQIEALTIVAGNVPVDMGVQNALYTMEQCGVTVPVYRGCEKPLLRDLETAQVEHGQDGMGDIGLALHGRVPAEGHAAVQLVEYARQYAGELTLVTLGPLTNIAVALMLDPALAQNIRECFIMGGISDNVGNVTPIAEYNIWVDPEAAKIVFNSGMNMTMVGWDISRKYATFNDAEKAELRAIGTPLAHFAVDIQASLDAYAKSQTQLAGFDLADPIAMAVAFDPTIAQITPYYVEVTTGEGLHRGQTVIDTLGMMGKPPNINVTLRADRTRFLEMLHHALG